MRQLLAILRDSFHESMDRRALQILCFIALAFIVLCFSISFEEVETNEFLEDQAKQLNRFRVSSGAGMAMLQTWMDTEFEVKAVRRIESADGFDELSDQAWVIEYDFEKEHQVNALVLSWMDFQRRHRDKYPDMTSEEIQAIEPDEAARVEYLRDRFREYGYTEVSARQIPHETEEGAGFLVAVEIPEGRAQTEVSGRHAISLMFGAFGPYPLGEMNQATLVVMIQQGLAGTFAGFLGMIILVMTCASFLPNLLSKGTLDLTLARPISRTWLLLSKYLGSIGFVFLLSAVLFLGCWCGLSIASGYWNPWFLACIFTLTATFAVIYSVTILFSVLTRSGTVAGLLTMGVWGLSSTIVNVRHEAENLFDDDSRVRTVIEWAYRVLPKISDIGNLNSMFLARSSLSEAAYNRVFASAIPDVDWWFSAGTTAVFTLIMLATAAHFFHRKDY